MPNDARTWDQLKPYMGAQAFPEPLATWKRHSPNEPDSDGEVLLCEATAAFVYSNFTPTRVAYRPGTRPTLEALVSEIILRDEQSPRSGSELTTRIFDWVFRHVTRRAKMHHGFRYFGTEEDIAAMRSGNDCYSTSKLFVVLVQMQGFPARLVHLMSDRADRMHTMAEVHLGGRWCFFDPSCHDYALNRDGAVASFWEILTDDYCRTGGLRSDPRKITPISDPDWLVNPSVQNYSIADSNRHYRTSRAAPRREKDTARARRTCRFGF